MTKTYLRYSIITLTIAGAIILSPILLMMGWFVMVFISMIGSLCFFMGLVEWAFTESKNSWEMVEFGWWCPPTLATCVFIAFLADKFIF